MASSLSLTSIVTSLLGLGYGLLFFTIFVVQAVPRTYITRRPSRQLWTDLSKDRKQLWDLSRSPMSGLKHAFYSCSHGNKIHYVTNTSSARKNLVVFIHGWPDSHAVWYKAIKQLRAPLLRDTAVIAFDLPGHGGSDGLARYNPNQVMETVVEFLVAMHEQYMLPASADQQAANKDAPGQCVIVGHDWGTVIGWRLAADAPQVADRFIMINGAIMPLVQQNARRRFQFAYQMALAWLQHPTNLNVLRSALVTLWPVLVQLICSYYVFVVRLPKTLVHIYGTWFGHFTMRLIQSLSLGYDREGDGPEVAERLASALGPGVQEINAAGAGGVAYGASTQQRAQQGNFFESVRVYRDGLAAGRWKQSETTTAALKQLEKQRKRKAGSSDRAGDTKEAGSKEAGTKAKVAEKEAHGHTHAHAHAHARPRGAVNAPTTVLWGELDEALDSRICVSGLADYLPARSQVFTMPSMGHWLPTQQEGPILVAETVAWAIAGSADTGTGTGTGAGTGTGSSRSSGDGPSEIAQRLRKLYPLLKVQAAK